MKSLIALLFVACSACTSAVPGSPGNSETRPDGSTPGASDGGISSDSGANSNVTITLTPTLVTLTVGESTTIDTTTLEDGFPITAEVLWESTDPVVASVGTSGRVEAKAAGTAVVTARIRGASASAMVTVSDVNSCTPSPGNNNDPCSDVYMGQDIWRCAQTTNLGVVSQVCRDNGSGPVWVSFNQNPTDCCTCAGAFDVGCCAPNSNNSGCP